MFSKKKFISDVAYYGIGRIVFRATALITLPIMTRTISPELYGVWTQIFITISLLIPFVTLGFQMTVVRFLSGLKDNEISQKFHLMLFLVGISGTILIIILSIFYIPISRILFGTSQYSSFIPLLVFELISEALFSLLIAFLRSQKKIKTLANFEIIRTIYRVSAIIIILLVAMGGIYEILLAFIIGETFLSLIGYYFFIFKKYAFAFSFHGIKEIICFSIPLIPNSALLWIIHASDKFFIVHLLDLSQAGIYSVAYTISNIIAMIFTPLGFVLYPALSHFYNIGETRYLKSIFMKSISYYIFISIPAIAGITILSNSIIQIFATSSYSVGKAVFLWVCLGIFMYGIFQFYAYLIHMTKKTYINTFIDGTAALLNLFLNALLIPYMGITGAALATFISYFILGILEIFYVCRHFQIYFPTINTLKTILATLVMIIVPIYLSPHTWLSLILVVIISFCFYLAVSSIFRNDSMVEIWDYIFKFVRSKNFLARV